jgi:hypothetical protein
MTPASNRKLSGVHEGSWLRGISRHTFRDVADTPRRAHRFGSFPNLPAGCFTKRALIRQQSDRKYSGTLKFSFRSHLLHNLHTARVQSGSPSYEGILATQQARVEKVHGPQNLAFSHCWGAGIDMSPLLRLSSSGRHARTP